MLIAYFVFAGIVFLLSMHVIITDDLLLKQCQYTNYKGYGWTALEWMAATLFLAVLALIPGINLLHFCFLILYIRGLL